MRLLYVIDSLTPSGAEHALAAMAPAYRSRGIDLHVIVLYERQPSLRSVIERAGATVTLVSGERGRLRAAIDLVRVTRRISPDVMHTTLFDADIVGRVASPFARVPVVSSLVNEAYGAPQQRAGIRSSRLRGARMLDRSTGKLVIRWHALTNSVARVMGARLRIDPARIDVIPRGRDPEVLGVKTAARRARARSQVGVEGPTPVVLALARHEYQKGLDVLLEAVPALGRAIPEVRVLIAGREGNQTSDLLERASALGIADMVRFLGPRSDPYDLICAADCLVIPSRWEGLGSVAVEGMALEAPIVASDIPPLRETIGNAGALYVAPEDPGSLAAAIEGCLGDPHRAAARAGSGYQRFQERFTLEKVVDQTVAFYERALSA